MYYQFLVVSFPIHLIQRLMRLFFSTETTGKIQVKILMKPLQANTV